MDDGCNSGSLYTMGFLLEENELLQEWLLNTYNIKTSIHRYKGYTKENSSKLIPELKNVIILYILKQKVEIYLKILFLHILFRLWSINYKCHKLLPKKLRELREVP